MSQASWTGAWFARAEMHSCNLEWLEMTDADFDEADLTGSLLTGTKIRGGTFRGTNLTRTGLAEIDWTGARMHGADLTEASFHMGSTRSGLVGSTIAGEGFRTGFYVIAMIYRSGNGSFIAARSSTVVGGFSGS